jgi:hypothetical protein
MSRRGSPYLRIKVKIRGRSVESRSRGRVHPGQHEGSNSYNLGKRSHKIPGTSKTESIYS